MREIVKEKHETQRKKVSMRFYLYFNVYVLLRILSAFIQGESNFEKFSLSHK